MKTTGDRYQAATIVNTIISENRVIDEVDSL